MKMDAVLDELEAAASKLGVKVSYEVLAETVGGGGLCKVKGAWVVIMDRKLPPAERAAMLIDALVGFDTDSVFLPPQVRDAIAAKRTDRAPVPAEVTPTT